MKTKILVLSFIIIMLGNTYAQTVPRPDHVIVLMLENYGYSNIVGSPNAPHINALINDPNAALFTQSYALSHPSQPNYVMLYSGNNQGITNDNIATNVPFNTCNLGSSLVSNGFTFKGFSEELPAVGDLSTTSGNYVRRHCPWTNWLATSGTNTLNPSVHQPYTSFPTNTNYSSLPTVSFVIPSLIDDMHNPTLPTPNYMSIAISNSDTWVYNNLTDYITWAKTHNSLLILTFDEDDGYDVFGVSTSTNQITTILIGQMVQGGSYSTHINHYNVLRTMEDMYGLSYCDSSANYMPITNCWVPGATGIKNIENKEDFTIFPNPASESINLDFYSASKQTVKIEVTNVLSQMVMSINKEVEVGNNHIQLSTEKFIPGNYFVNVIDAQKSMTKKVVIK
jgi:hypothetical protein